MSSLNYHLFGWGVALCIIAADCLTWFSDDWPWWTGIPHGVAVIVASKVLMRTWFGPPPDMDVDDD